MKDRELPCIHYQYEGCCDLGKDGEFRGICQTCPSYKKKAGARPARTDTRRQRRDRAEKKEKY